MRLLSLTTLVICASARAVMAQAPAPSDCRAFSVAIEDAEKDMSAVVAEGIVDNSAPREAMRQQRIGNDLQMISLDLTLAGQAHCPPRKEPVRTTAYFLNATDCGRASADVALAVARGGAQPEHPPTECVRTNWKRDAEK